MIEAEIQPTRLIAEAILGTLIASGVVDRGDGAIEDDGPWLSSFGVDVDLSPGIEDGNVRRFRVDVRDVS